jgi:hypothetical protein
MYVAVGGGFVKDRYLAVKRIYFSFCGRDAAVLMYPSGWGLVCFKSSYCVYNYLLFLVD